MVTSSKKEYRHIPGTRTKKSKMKTLTIHELVNEVVSRNADRTITKDDCARLVDDALRHHGLSERAALLAGKETEWLRKLRRSAVLLTWDIFVHMAIVEAMNDG